MVAPWWHRGVVFITTVQQNLSSGSLTMVPAGNKAKRFSLVKHTTKIIHQHHHHQQLWQNNSFKASF